MAVPAGGASKPAATTSGPGAAATARPAASSAPAAPRPVTGPVFTGTRARPGAARPGVAPVVTGPASRRRPFSYEPVIIGGLWLSAAFYAVAAVAVFLLASRPVMPAGLEIGEPLDHALLAMAAAVLAGASAFLYGVPHHLGGHLWSVPLGATHLVTFNVAFLAGAVGLHVLHDVASAGWGPVALLSVAAHAVWLVALGVNLAQSFKTVGGGSSGTGGGGGAEDAAAEAPA